jgi:outer membrane lipoprotein-sorting protein
MIHHLHTVKVLVSLFNFRSLTKGIEMSIQALSIRAIAIVFLLGGCSGGATSAGEAAAVQTLKGKISSPSSFNLIKSSLIWQGKNGSGVPAYVFQLNFDAQNGFGAVTRGCQLVAVATDGKSVWSGNKSTGQCFDFNDNSPDNKMLAEAMAKANGFTNQ